MVETARVYNDNGDITVDTQGYNQYVIESGTLTSAQRDIYNGLTYDLGFWSNNDFGGPIRWWPDPHELASPLGTANTFSSTTRNNATPGGDSTSTDAINTWDFFRPTRHLGFGIGTNERDIGSYYMCIFRTDGSIHSNIESKGYRYYWSTDTVSLTTVKTPNHNRSQHLNKSDNGLVRFLPRNVVTNIVPTAYLDKTALPVSTTNVNVKPPNWFPQRTERYHTHISHSSTLSLYDGTYPNRTYTTRETTINTFTAYKLVVDIDDTNGHKVDQIIRKSDNTDVTSNFTGWVCWNEGVGSSGTDTQYAGGRAFKQMFLGGTCIYHAYSNNVSSSNTQASPDWDSATWNFGSENPTSTKIHTGNAANPGSLKFIQYNGRFYSGTAPMTTQPIYTFAANTDQGYVEDCETNDTTPTVYKKMIASSSAPSSYPNFFWGMRIANICDSLYSYVGKEMYPDHDMRFYFKVNSGEWVGMGPGQYQNSNGDSGHGSNNKDGLNQWVYGITSTQTSVDYFVAGRATKEDLKNEDQALEILDEDSNIMFTTRNNHKLLTLDGVGTTDGNWQSAKTSAVFTNVSADNYIHIKFFPSLLSVLNTSAWPANAVRFYRCMPWIHRDGTSIYVQWYPQRANAYQNHLVHGAGSTSLTEVQTISQFLMHAALPT